MKQFLRFACVGTAGFLCDSVVLYAALAAGFGNLTGRLISFFFATILTWWLNRQLTFQHSRIKPSMREFGKYLAAMALGGMVNYGAYYFAVQNLSSGAWRPLFAVAIGSFAGMLVNYTSVRVYVFKK